MSHLPALHAITIDEQPANSQDPAAFKAFCTDECLWSGSWHYADTDYRTPEAEWQAIDTALADAAAEGEDHLASAQSVLDAPALTTTPPNPF